MPRTSWVIVLSVLAIACAGVQGASVRERDEFTTGNETFAVEYAPADTQQAQEVKAVLKAVLPLVRRWGEFTTPVTIRIQPTHAALEAATFHFGYPWLRAWARYDSIDLQSPRTWNVLPTPLGAIAEVLTHELTHCLMYQHIGDSGTWSEKTIPLWFREGMASVTAHQGYRRPDDATVSRYLSEHAGRDPVLDADSLYRSEPEIVYGAAHDAFLFLDRRYGDSAITALLQLVGQGLDFDTAFQQTFGIGADAFAREYLRYLRWGGWRGPLNDRISFPLR